MKGKVKKSSGLLKILAINKLKLTGLRATSLSANYFSTS